MSKSARLVVIGTGRALRRAAEGAATATGLELTVYGDIADFVGEDHAHGVGCIVVGLKKPGVELDSIDGLAPYARRWPVIVCAAEAGVATVVKAMKWGAFDFLTSFGDDDLTQSVEQALAQERQARLARRRLEQLQNRLGALTRREAAVLQVAMGAATDPAPLLEALRSDQGQGERGRSAGNPRKVRRRPGERARRERPRAARLLRHVEGVEELTPRLRQTLEHLLQGDSEKQVASRMELSQHTVHDYIKALHKHFGVCSRGELLAHCLGTVQEADEDPPGGVVC